MPPAIRGLISFLELTQRIIIFIVSANQELLIIKDELCK
jgi:hypothetical protein